MPPDTEPPKRTAVALPAYSEWMAKNGKSVATRKQYEAPVRLFLLWLEDTYGEEGYEPADEGAMLFDGEEWIRERRQAAGRSQKLHLSQSTIDVYCSALNSYAKSKNWSINMRGRSIRSIAAQEDKPKPSKKQGQTVNDEQLKEIRRRAGISSARRAAIELVLAGLSYDEIASMRDATIEFSASYRMAIIGVKKKWSRGAFDPKGVKWLARDESQKAIAELDDWSTQRIARNIQSSCRGVFKGPPFKALRETGARTGVESGFSPKVIARAWGISNLPARWWSYAKPDKTGMALEPIVAEWEPVDPELSAEASLAMSIDEWNAKLDERFPTDELEEDPDLIE